MIKSITKHVKSLLHVLSPKSKEGKEEENVWDPEFFKQERSDLPTQIERMYKISLQALEVNLMALL